MKKKLTSILVALLIVFTMIPTVGTVNVKAYEYEVTNIRWGEGTNAKVVSWDPVPGATKYEIHVGSGGGNCVTTSKDCAWYILSTGDYTPQITAYNGDDQITETATGPTKHFEITPLDTPKNVKYENGIITWDAVPNATDYTVNLCEYSERNPYYNDYSYVRYYSQTNSISFDKFKNDVEDGKSYYFSVWADDKNYNYGTSGYGKSTFFTYVAPVLPEISNIKWDVREDKAILTWDAVEGAAYYQAYCSANGGGGRYNTNQANFTAFVSESGEYCPTVVAYSSNDDALTKVTTGPARYFDVTPLATPQNIKYENGMITWDAVPGATEYTVNLCVYSEKNPYYNDSSYVRYYSNTNSISFDKFKNSATDGEKYYFSIWASDKDTISGRSGYGKSTYFTYHLTYNVTTSVNGSNGTISEGKTVNNKESYTVTVTPETGYVLSYLKVNGVDVSAEVVDNQYTISNIVKDYSVIAAFTQCVHVWNEGTVTKQASCKEKGEKLFTCTKCEGTKTEDIAKTTNHNFTTNEEPATCGANGLKTFDCTICGLHKEEVLGKTGNHDLGEEFVKSEPSCTSTGIKARACKNCDYQEEQSIEATGHSETLVSKNAIAATYTTKGKKADQHCSKCDTLIVEGTETDYLKGWHKESGKWYYHEGGVAKTSWFKDGGKWYYFNTDGTMVTGWKQVSSKWYYFETSGTLVSGWKQILGKWYYFEISGAMVTGWKQISGKWYYFETSGAMVSGWKQISGKWYYFETSGAMVTGWKQISGKWYYFETSGAMVTGWKQIGSKWYYFKSGVMVTGTQTIGGKTYTFDANGVWIK